MHSLIIQIHRGLKSKGKRGKCLTSNHACPKCQFQMVATRLVLAIGLCQAVPAVFLVSEPVSVIMRVLFSVPAGNEMPQI